MMCFIEPDISKVVSFWLNINVKKSVNEKFCIPLLCLLFLTKPLSHAQFGPATYQGLSSQGKLVAILVDRTALANGFKLQMQPRKNTRAIRGKPGGARQTGKRGSCPHQAENAGPGMERKDISTLETSTKVPGGEQPSPWGPDLLLPPSRSLNPPTEDF